RLQSDYPRGPDCRWHTMAIRKARSADEIAVARSKTPRLAALAGNSSRGAEYLRLYHPERSRTGRHTSRYYGHHTGHRTPRWSHLQHVHRPGTNSPVDEYDRSFRVMGPGFSAFLFGHAGHRYAYAVLLTLVPLTST